MIAQSNFMIAAPINPGREAELRALLLSMNKLPGFADPHNVLVPFAEFDTIHFARFVILKDETVDDLAEFYGPAGAFPDAPVYLAFLGDCDGPAEALLRNLANRAEAGLRKIFSYCEGFDPEADLLQWMQSHSVKPAAAYVNTIGRTVRQIREEAELREALQKHLAKLAPDGAIKQPPGEIRKELIRLVKESGPWLTPLESTFPLQARRVGFLAAAALVLVLPFLLLSFHAALLFYAAIFTVLGLALGAFLALLRKHETTDPDLARPPKPPTHKHLAALAALQDHDVTNQYTAFGQVRPGVFARRLTVAALWLIDFAGPLLYPAGHLARVQTIHFARWVFLDGKRRALFASNYDGSYESYMDDFVNKVSFGLNLAFSQALNWPKTRFLIWGGAESEQDFKNYQRRHTLPTETWYKAYPGLSLSDIARNARIRQGLEREQMSETEARQWLAEL